MVFDYLKSVSICSYLQTKTNTTNTLGVSPFEKRPECPVYPFQLIIIPAPLLQVLLLLNALIHQLILIPTLPCPLFLASKAQLLSLKRGKNSPNEMKSVVSSIDFHILTFNNRPFERKSNQNLPENGLSPQITIGHPNALDLEASLYLPRELSLLSNPTRH